MIKLLIIALVVVVVFWMGRKSAQGRKKLVDKKHSEDKSQVIDIETKGLI